jgi:hypothetical protein
MTTTVALLGARVLRKLGVAIVAATASPAPAGIVSQADLASRALRAVGINPAAIDSGAPTGIVYNCAAIATEVLLKLAVISSEETPSTPDITEAVSRVEDVHDILAGADYVTWTVEAIPASVAEFYIVMAANFLAPQFGKAASQDAITAAQAMIRQQALEGPYGQALAVLKVAEVHEVLNTSALVTWLVSAVPVGVAEPYVRMTASLLAPIFGYQQTEKDAWQVGAAAVRRAAIIAGGQALAQQKIMAVQYSLEARGLTRWGGVYDIPTWAEEIMVLLAAVLMAPECDVKADPNWGPAAERDLMRIISLPSERQTVQAVYF